MWVREKARAVRDTHGRTVVLIVCENVTSRREMEGALRQSRERYRQLYTKTPTMLHSIGNDYRLMDVSDRWLEVLGYRRDEVIGRKSTDFLTEASRKFAEETALPEFIAAGESRDVPYQFVKKNGEVVSIELSAMVERDGNGEVVRYLAVLTDVTERRKAQDGLQRAHDEMEQRVKDRTAALRESESALRRSQAELQALAGRLITAQEDERRRLAREMHDDLTQKLAALSMRCGRFAAQRDAPSAELFSEMREAQQELASLSADAQAFSRRLHPAILEDLGLVDTLQTDCGAFAKRTGIEVGFHARGVPSDLPKELALSLYRITQEALHNVEKHASARDVRVALLGVENTLTLSVEDTGAGFDRSASRGLGLASMAERARLIEAELSIDSRPGKGTLIEVRVPLPSA